MDKTKLPKVVNLDNYRYKDQRSAIIGVATKNTDPTNNLIFDIVYEFTPGDVAVTDYIRALKSSSDPLIHAVTILELGVQTSKINPKTKVSAAVAQCPCSATLDLVLDDLKQIAQVIGV